MNVQTIELELSKERALAQAVRIGQGDSDGTTIAATVYDGGVAAQLSGMSARFCMRLPDGTHYVRDSDCSVSGSQITYVVDEEHCASVHGKTDDAYFELVDGDTVYSTSRFTVIVLRSAEDADTSPAESWDNNFDEWLEGKDAEVAQIETRLIDEVNSAVSDAEEAMQQAVSDTEEVIDRAEDAIEAIGDISELAVPEMSDSTRGGAKLEEHGGLALRDGALGIGSLVQESDGYARGGLAEVTAKGHAEQDGTPTPDNPVPIQVVRGRNLAKPMEGGWYIDVGTGRVVKETLQQSYIARVEPNTAYVLTFSGGNRLAVGAVASESPSAGSSVSLISTTTVTSMMYTFTSGATNYVMIYLSANANTNPVEWAQLTLGSTPQPYVPYGHVGMEARDPDTDELISCTALPLPSRGWVAGLPDGTADELRLDGAGKCEWTLPTSEVVFDGSSDEGWFAADSGTKYNRYNVRDTQLGIPIRRRNDSGLINFCDHFIAESNTTTENNKPWGIFGFRNDGWLIFFDTDNIYTIMNFRTWLSTHPITVLYPLATPVTEDCGYVDMPEISGECTISIPELDAIGIKYFVDDTVTQYGREIYARVRSKYADRLTALEQAVAELATS